MTPFHQIAMPPHDSIRPDEEPQPVQNIAGKRRQESGEERSILRSEPHPSTDAELPFEIGELVTRGEHLDVLVSIAQRQQPQRRESVRDGQAGKAKKHDWSSCRTIPLQKSKAACKVVTWTDEIIGRHNVGAHLAWHKPHENFSGLLTWRVKGAA
ncbi:hypothetical protein [Herbidospora sp. RD11066]